MVGEMEKRKVIIHARQETLNAGIGILVPPTFVTLCGKHVTAMPALDAGDVSTAIDAVRNLAAAADGDESAALILKLDLDASRMERKALESTEREQARLKARWEGQRRRTQEEGAPWAN